MDIKHYFFVTVSSLGKQTIGSNTFPKEYSFIDNMLVIFPNLTELNWVKDQIHKGILSGERTNVGQNILNIFIENNIAEFSISVDPSKGGTIPIDNVLQYVDKAIKFLEKYKAGDIPGLKPNLT